MNKIIYLAFLLLCGCGSMNTIESSVETGKTNRNVQPPNFNVDLKMRYMVTNDSKSLHVKLSSQDFGIITKILTTGLRVSFDVKGKKNNKVYVEYPLYQKQMFSDRIMARTRVVQRENYSLNKLMSEVPNVAVYSSFGKIDTLSQGKNDTDIKVSINQLNRGEIVYDLFIPFNLISKNGINDLSNLTIGVVTKPANVPNITGQFRDVSGQDAFGSSNLSASLNVDKYARTRPGVPTPSRINDFWFKVHLAKAK